MKNLLSIIMVALLFVSVVPVSAANDVTVYLNGTLLEFDVPAQIIDDRTMVPMRKIFESLGAVVSWDAPTRTATGTKDDTTVSVSIDSNILLKNGVAKSLDVAPKLIDGRTLVPARAIAESFDCVVDWVPETRRVLIKTGENAVTPELSGYVDGLVDNVAAATKAHMKEDSMCLVVFADTHYTANNNCFPTLIARKLAEATDASAVLHLGDLAHMATEGKDVGVQMWQKHSAILSGMAMPYFQVVGNHDDGNIYLHSVTNDYSAENYLTAEEMYDATTKQSETFIDGMGSQKGWFYLDDEKSKTRIIVLNSHDYPWVVNEDGTLAYDSNALSSVAAVYSPEQLEWLANVALDFSDKDNEAEWGVLAFAHMGTSNWANVNVLFQDFKTGTKSTRFGGYKDSTGLYDYSNLQANLTNDFSKVGPRRIAFLLGDNHVDREIMSNGYPIVQFLNASLAKDKSDAPLKTSSTPTETAVSVLVITPSENTITELRFGAGTKKDGTYDPLTDFDNYRVFEY